MESTSGIFRRKEDAPQFINSKPVAFKYTFVCSKHIKCQRKKFRFRIIVLGSSCGKDYSQLKSERSNNRNSGHQFNELK